MEVPPERQLNEPRRHHYVPEFLLRPWARNWTNGQLQLRGHYWDTHRKTLRYRQNGVGAFCHSIDLLTLRGRREGKAVLESRFFQAIDQQGRKSIDAILEKGVEALGSSERSDFARLMLSLEWRRPKMVERLRTEGTAKLIAELDDDPAIVDELRRQGIDETPSRFAQRRFGWSLEDRAMLIIQKLVDSRAVGERVINAYWFTKRLRHDHGCFMLGDRPLVRTHGLGHEAATWFIPLSPKVGFFATLHANNRRLLQKASARTIVEKANISTAAQAERFVFSVEKFFPPMMAAYLRPSGVAELNQLPHKGASPTAG